MKPSIAKLRIKTCLLSGSTALVTGNAGIAKSSICYDIAHELYEGRYIDPDLSNHDPVDIIGVPKVVNGMTEFNPTSLLPRAETHGETGLLILDEYTTAPKMNQNLATKVCRDRRMGNWNMPAGWGNIVIANLEGQGGHTIGMAATAQTRFVEIPVEADLDDWVKHFASRPDAVKLADGSGHPIETEIVSALRVRTELFAQFVNRATAQPNPRTWAEFSKNLTVIKMQGGEGVESAIFDIGKGTVGEGPTSEFIAHYKIHASLPDLNEILRNPDNFQAPQDPAVRYAISTALAHRATVDNFDRVIACVSKLPAEFSVLTVKDALARTPDLGDTRAFAKWATDNTSVLI